MTRVSFPESNQHKAKEVNKFLFKLFLFISAAYVSIAANCKLSPSIATIGTSAAFKSETVRI